MSKLDNIVLECANKVLDGKEEKLGDYIDPTKQQIKDLMLELIGEDQEAQQPIGLSGKDFMHYKRHVNALANRNKLRDELRQKVEEL